MDTRLTLKQQQFVDAYLASGNGTDAYQKTHKGCKRTTAEVEASRTLSKPKIRNQIQEALKKLAITPYWLIGNVKKLTTKKEKGIVKFKALEYIGKLAGYHEESPQVQINVQGEQVAILAREAARVAEEVRKELLDEE